MKTALLMLSLLVWKWSAYGQGTIQYYDRVRPTMGPQQILEFYGGTNTTPSITPVPPAMPPVLTSVFSGGLISSMTNAAPPNSNPGSFLQVRAWDNVGGTITSWASVQPVQPFAQLALFSFGPPLNPWPFYDLPTLMAQIRSGEFEVTTWNPPTTTVPEPGTVAIASFAAAAILYARRRR
jgi:hypothetical protein